MSYEANLRVGIQASNDVVYRTLTEPKELARWWTSDTRGKGDHVGDTLEFWFGEFCQKFVVEELQPGKLVRWKATQGMEEWAGTEVSFTLSTKGPQSFVRFQHAGWRANTDFFAHCSTKWTTFLLSLKSYLEKGVGTPAPNDVPIEHR